MPSVPTTRAAQAGEKRKWDIKHVFAFENLPWHTRKAGQSPGQRRVRLRQVSSWWSAARAGKKQWCVAKLDSRFCKGGRVQCSYFCNKSRSNHHHRLVARLWKLLSLVSLWLATGDPGRWHGRAISQHSCRSMRQQHSAFAFRRSFAHGALRSLTKTTVACSTSWRC